MKVLKRITDIPILLADLEAKKFITDEHSNMPRFSGEKEIPIDVIKKVAHIRIFSIYETDEENTYVIRRGEAPPQPFKTIWDFKDKIIELFPDMAEAFREALKITEKPNCSNCKRNSQKRLLIEALSGYILENPNIDITPLAEIHGQLAPYVTSLKQETNRINDKTGIPREDCIECTGKHLAQAYVLLKESLQTYPEHVEYALTHIEEAVEVCPADRKPDLERIHKDLTAIIDIKDLEHKSVQHLRKVMMDLKSNLTLLDREIGISIWIAIGHLAEASDECIDSYPELAMEIREERLKLMESAKYDIPIKYLLNKAKAILNVQDKSPE